MVEIKWKSILIGSGVWSRGPEKAGNSIKYPLTLHHVRTMRPARTIRQQKGKALDEYKRTYKACIPCARRKVKCESEGGKCRRCITKKLDCTYTSKKPWSRDQGDRPSARPEREDSGPRYVFETFGVFEADVPRTLGSTSDGNSRGGPGML